MTCEEEFKKLTKLETSGTCIDIYEGVSEDELKEKYIGYQKCASNVKAHIEEKQKELKKLRRKLELFEREVGFLSRKILR